MLPVTTSRKPPGTVESASLASCPQPGLAPGSPGPAWRSRNVPVSGQGGPRPSKDCWSKGQGECAGGGGGVLGGSLAWLGSGHCTFLPCRRAASYGCFCPTALLMHRLWGIFLVCPEGWVMRRFAVVGFPCGGWVALGFGLHVAVCAWESHLCPGPENACCPFPGCRCAPPPNLPSSFFGQPVWRETTLSLCLRLLGTDCAAQDPRMADCASFCPALWVVNI